MSTLFANVVNEDRINSLSSADLNILADILDIGKKKKPNWYGIHGIKFVWHNSWADPELYYKGTYINAAVVEDAMWARFLEEYSSSDGDKFAQYMKSHANEVKELCDTFLNEC